MSNFLAVRSIDRSPWNPMTVWREKLRSERVNGVWRDKPYLKESRMHRTEAFTTDEDLAALQTNKIIVEMMNSED